MNWRAWWTGLRSEWLTRPACPRRRGVRLCASEALETRELLTVQFLFDYSFDSNNFFADSSRRDLLEQAGDILSSFLNDQLLALQSVGGNTWTALFVNPSTGMQTSLNNLLVPADALVVFVGARDFTGGDVAHGGPGGFTADGTQAWLNQVQARGQGGALAAIPTDFGPWGGTLAFDSVGTSWHFGSSTSGLASNEVDFLSVAVHELGHLLGIGTSDSWWRWVVGGAFTGPQAVSAYDFNGNPPLSPDRAHWANGTLDGNQETAMDPSLAGGVRKLFTGLDYAALNDIGWNTSIAPAPYGVSITPTTTLTTSESGTTASFNLVLNSAPTSNVTIQLTVGDLTEGRISKSIVSFTSQNWNIPQTVTVTGVNDSLADGDQTYLVTTSNVFSTDSNYNGLVVDDITITNLDDETTSLAGINVTPTNGLQTSENGGSSNFSIVLTAPPSANVTIPISSSNTQEGRVSVSNVVFTAANWDQPQVITVTGVNDARIDGNVNYTIITGAAVSTDLNYRGLNAADVQVTNIGLTDLPPQITLTSLQPTYRKDGVAVLIDPAATVRDLDSAVVNLNQARLIITIATNRNSADRLAVQGNGAVTTSSDGSSIRYNGVTIATRSGGSSTPMIVTFNAQATMAGVEAVLRSVNFRTTTSNKSNLPRTLTAQLTLPGSSSSNLATKTIQVLTGATPPQVALADAALQYQNNSGAQLVDTTATVTDPDSINFSGGKMTISGAVGGDLLQIRREGTQVGQIDAKNGTLYFSGRAFATWSGGKNGKPLVITFKSNATEAGVQALLRNLTFEATNKSAAGATKARIALNQRTLQVTMTDGDGGTSLPVQKIVQIV